METTYFTQTMVMNWTSNNSTTSMRSKSLGDSYQDRGRNNYQDAGVDGLIIYIGVASPIALLCIIVWYLLKYEYARVERMITFINERRTMSNNSQ